VETLGCAVSVGTASATLSPFPARKNISTQYRVTAVDSITGAAITQGTVQIFDNGQMVLTAALGATFNFTFRSHKVTHCTFDPKTHQRDCERVDVFPTVRVVQLPAPYATTQVATGL